MNQISISFYSPHFHPEKISTGKYNTLLVQGLLQRGASVRVITSHPLYPSWRPVFSREPFLNASIHRGGAWLRYPAKPLLRRLLLEFWFSFHAFKKCFATDAPAAILVAVFPPSLYFLLVHLFTSSSARRVAIVHDLQGILGLNDANFLTRALNRIVRWVESRAFHSCDKVIALSDQMANTMATVYSVNPRKLAVCYPFATIPSRACTAQNLQSLLPDGIAHVVYSGALGRKQDSLKLFQFFLAASAELPAVRFHIFSAGPAFIHLRNSNSRSSAVQFHDLVPESDLEELYARSTVQFLPQVQAASGACFPSKLPNILAAGVPVLAVCDPQSDLARIVNQTAGAVAGSWETSVLLAHLRELLQQASAQNRQARQEAVKDILASRFGLDALLDSILGTPISEPHGMAAPVRAA